MKISAQSIKDLRTELRKKYGADIDNDLTDDEICEIGVFILNTLALSLK